MELHVALRDGANTYVYGLDLISATDNGGAQTYFLYDGLGSATDLTDGTGNSVAGYTYDVFGAIQSQSGGSSNYWLFTGEQRDAESSLYYLRARYYDLAIGRFLAQDPARAGHPYVYVGNNPLIFVDPYGLDLCGTVGGLFGKKDVSCGDVIDTGQKVFGQALDSVCNPYVAAIGCAAIEGLRNVPWEDLGYVDINGTVCSYLCLTGGLQASFGQGIHPYAGSGLGFGASVSATVAPGQSISTGWNCGLQGSYGFLAAQVGAGIDIKEGGLNLDPWVEVGVTLAASTPTYTCYYVW